MRPLADPYIRFTQPVAANAVDLERTPATFSAPLAFGAATETFLGEIRVAAHRLRCREDRAPSTVSQLA